MHARSSHRLAKSIVLLALVGGCSGCATTYRVKVDAVSHAARTLNEERLSYRLVSANPGVTSSELQDRQAAELARTALSSKGLYEAPVGVEPDMVVEYDFDISEPRREVIEQEVMCYVLPSSREPSSSTAAAPPAVEKRAVVRKVIIVYEKSVRLSARETPGQSGDHPPREIWSIYATSTDESNDLDAYVPVLLAAAMDDIATHQASIEEVTLTARDERVAFVRRGM